VQFDRETDILDKKFKSRAFGKSFEIPDGVLSELLKDKIEEIHGNFGRAAVTTGLRTIYSNAETRLALIQCRHGPHRLVGSSLPFLTKIKDEKVVPRLIYTGATIKKCKEVSFL